MPDVQVKIKISDGGGFKTVSVDAEDLKNAISSVQQESEKVKSSLVNWSQASQAFKNFRDLVGNLESAFSDLGSAYSELSKLIIGQTMTIEDGSSLSQSQTHLKVMEHLLEADCDMIRDVINNQLLPRMVKHGFPIDGLRFEWDYSTDYTPEQQRSYEELVLNNYEVDPKYFEEKYGMPVGERRATVPDGSQSGIEEGNQHNARPFFD